MLAVYFTSIEGKLTFRIRLKCKRPNEPWRWRLADMVAGSTNINQLIQEGPVLFSAC